MRQVPGVETDFDCIDSGKSNPPVQALVITGQVPVIQDENDLALLIGFKHNLCKGFQLLYRTEQRAGRRADIELDYLAALPASRICDGQGNRVGPGVNLAAGFQVGTCKCSIAETVSKGKQHPAASFVVIAVSCKYAFPVTADIAFVGEVQVSRCVLQGFRNGGGQFPAGAGGSEQQIRQRLSGAFTCVAHLQDGFHASGPWHCHCIAVKENDNGIVLHLQHTFQKLSVGRGSVHVFMVIIIGFAGKIGAHQDHCKVRLFCGPAGF